MAHDARDAGAVTKVERPERLATEKRHENEWYWLGIATVGGALLGGLILGVDAYAEGDSAALSRGDWAFLAAFIGAIAGLIAGFVLWALWVLLREAVRSFSQTR